MHIGIIIIIAKFWEQQDGFYRAVNFFINRLQRPDLRPAAGVSISGRSPGYLGKHRTSTVIKCTSHPLATNSGEIQPLLDLELAV